MTAAGFSSKGGGAGRRLFRARLHDCRLPKDGGVPGLHCSGRRYTTHPKAAVTEPPTVKWWLQKRLPAK
ncbi:hypothetical protein KI387_043565, partial [Taxus chinensis]